MVTVSEILNRISNFKQSAIFTTDNPKITFSKPNIFSDDQLQTVLITPPAGKRLLIKGITMITDALGGSVLLERGNGIPSDSEINTNIILPLYATTQSKSSVSGEISLALDVDETLDLEIDGITPGKHVFVGVSYRIIEKSEA